MKTIDFRTGRSGTVRALAAAAPIVLAMVVQTAAAAPPPGKGKPGSGDGTGGASCNYPAFADVPRKRLERRERKRRYDDFVAAERFEWVRNFIEATAPLELLDALPDETSMTTPGWTHETMVDPLNRSGNANIDEFGRACAGCTPEGKRFSAWYELDSSVPLVDKRCLVEGGASAACDPAAEPPLPTALSLRGEVGGMPGDLTRPGTDPWKDIRPRTGWLKTWERAQTSGQWVAEGALREDGKHKFMAPMYLEAEVNFSRMRTPGYRVSLWLMPATFDPDLVGPGENPFPKKVSTECNALQGNLLTNGCYSDPGPEFRSEAYDRNWKNGYEMDIFEFEPVDVIAVPNPDPDGDATVPFVCGNAIEFSALNDYVSERGKDTEYAVKNHFEGFEEGYCDPAVDYGELSCDKNYANPRPAGTDYLINDDVWHKVGFLWTETELNWIFNDEIVLEITDPARVPHPAVQQYLNLSREMTNGRATPVISPTAVGDDYATYLPAESGLYGWDGRSNVGDFLDNIADDEALFRSIRVWDLSGAPGRP